MNALNKPYGRSFSASWIGVIDYSSGAFRLYPRGQIQGLCKANKQSLKDYRVRYNELHPSYCHSQNDKDLMILPWLMNFQSFSSSVFYGSLQKALWLSCQSSPEIPDQR